MQHKEWSNTLDVPDAFYKGACADLSKHAGLRPIEGSKMCIRDRAMGFQKDYQYVITGIIVILAVYADVRSKKRKN